MSARRVSSAVVALRESAAEAAWTQWGAVFTIAAGRRAARATVDPEALLLASMALAKHEPRLWRVARLWARDGSRLTSVQRTKNIVRMFPPHSVMLLKEFARIAVDAGGDIRWRPLVGAAPSREAPGRREPPSAPVFEGGAALMLRLRLAFGVGMKADVVAYLVGLAGGRATVQQIAGATAYYGRAVRRALEELVASGFLEARPTSPASFRVELDRWAGLLRIDAEAPPSWRSWASVYAFVADVDAWWLTTENASGMVVASEARDLVTRHARALELTGVRLPRPDERRGEDFLEPFVAALGSCDRYFKSAV